MSQKIQFFYYCGRGEKNPNRKFFSNQSIDSFTSLANAFYSFPKRKSALKVSKTLGELTNFDYSLNGDEAPINSLEKSNASSFFNSGNSSHLLLRKGEITSNVQSLKLFSDRHENTSEIKPNEGVSQILYGDLNYTPPVFINSKVPNIYSRNIFRFLFTIVYGEEKNNLKSAGGQDLRKSPTTWALGGVPPLQNFGSKLRKGGYPPLGTHRLELPPTSQLTILGILPVFLFFGTVQTSNYVRLLKTNPNLTMGETLASNLPQKVHSIYTAEVSSGTFSPSNQTQGLMRGFYLQNSLEENLLRIPDYVSKIFIVWGLLYIWKGVRPQRKMFKEGGNASSQTRIIWPNQPSGGLRRLLGSRKNRSLNTKSQDSLKITNELKGLTAFLPILETLIQSLRTGSQIGFKFRPPESFQSLQPFAKKHLTRRQSSGKYISKSYAPKGYLFVGPPGTGKTLLAQAIAREAKVPLLCVSASEIQKQIEIGTRIGALRLRKLFEQARRLAPCILFLDEIDAIGRSRGNEEQNSPEGGTPSAANLSSADLKLFTEFLVQMDSFPGPGNPGGFVVIGTTNFLSSLDSAFIRSGRFDRILGLNYPAKQVRIEILQWYSGVPSSLEQNGTSTGTNMIPWNYFGYFTEGFSPADLSRVVNESMLANCKPNTKRSQVGFDSVHTFESLQKGLNRIQVHKKYLL